MFQRFYGLEQCDPQVQQFADRVQELKIDCSSASIQGLMLLYKYEPKTAIENVKRLLSPLDKRQAVS